MPIHIDPWIWVAIALAAAAIAIALLSASARRRRLEASNGRLQARTLQREAVLTPVTPGARERYREEWLAIQARFVQVPVESLRDAERLVGSIMRDRGYPYLDAPLRPDAIESSQPALANAYRDSRRVSRRLDVGSKVDLDEMRQAMINYSEVVLGLLEIKVADKPISPQPEEGTPG